MAVCGPAACVQSSWPGRRPLQHFKTSLWFCVPAIPNRASRKNDPPYSSFYLLLWRTELLVQTWAQEEKSKLEVNPCVGARDVSRLCDSWSFCPQSSHSPAVDAALSILGLILGIFPPKGSSALIWKGQVSPYYHRGQYYYGVLFALMEANERSWLTSAQLKRKCGKRFCVCSDSGIDSRLNAWSRGKKLFAAFAGPSL